MKDYRILAVGLLFAAGCSLLTSDHLPQGSPSGTTTAAYYFLPKAMLHVQLKKAGDAYQLKYLDPEIVPDNSRLYRFDYHASALSEDTLNVQIGPNGLLKKIDSSTEDKSGQIILKLAEIAKEAAKAAIAFPGGVGAGEADFIFSPEDVQQINQRIKVIAPGGPQMVIDPPVLSQSSSIETDHRDGVCFRPKLAHTLTFFDGGVPVETHTLLMPNGAPILELPIKRAAFVKKITNVTFEDGILTEVHLEKPSEGLACMEIPLAIAKDIASLPAELIQLKINYNNQNAELSNAEKNAIDAAIARQAAAATPIPSTPHP